MQQLSTFRTRLRRLQHLRQLIQRLVGKRRRGSAGQLARLRHRATRLLRDLTKRAALAPAAALLLGAAIPATAQVTFGPVKINAFGLTASQEGVKVPTYADLDGDGDVDILATGYSEATEEIEFFYYPNEGTATSPQFGMPVLNPFGIAVGTLTELAIPQLVDLDGDGDFDLLFSGYNFAYFENTGTGTAPAFSAPVPNPFGLAAATVTDNYVIPTFGDLDDDGDLDMVLGTYEDLRYVENTGSASAPQFGDPVSSPFGIDPAIYDEDYIFPALADLDSDGDIDLVVSQYYGIIQFLENTGTPQVPSFETPPAAVPNLEATVADAILLGGAADFDDDGDLDLLFTQYYDQTDWIYFENRTVPPVSTQPLPADLELVLGPQPAAATVEIRTNYALRDLTLYDAFGRVVLRPADGADQLQVDQLAPGIYRFEARLNNGSRLIRSVSVAR